MEVKISNGKLQDAHTTSSNPIKNDNIDCISKQTLLSVIIIDLDQKDNETFS